MVTYNKKEFVEFLAAQYGIDKSVAKLAVDTFTAGVTQALRAGDSVAISGFGAFEVSRRADRVNVNIATGAPVKVKAHNAVVFRAGKPLKEAVNE